MKTPNLQKKLHGLLFLAFLLTAVAAQAQPSSANSISFQGALTGANGQPLPNANYNLTFQFWDHPTATAASNQVGSATTVSSVAVSGGVASTAIPVDPATFNGQTRYLGISVNGSAELAPRVLVTAVPYAMAAQRFNGSRLDLIGDSVVLNLQNTSDPEGGFWSLQPNAFVAGNFGVVRYVGSAREAQSFVITKEGKVGIGTSTPDAALDCAGLGGLLVRDVQGHTALHVDPATGYVGIGGYVAHATLDVYGTARVQVLQITGGSDVAEPFDVTAPDADTKIQPGMVMVIDRKHDGKLTPCTKTYDTAVAGILSGANGLAPGLVMKAEGQPHADGEQPLAMTGRVWCWVDASSETGGGPVKRGDRLTTSRTLGHAMKVSNKTKAPGSVIGKAMTELASNKGLVLVLVNLQ